MASFFACLFWFLAIVLGLVGVFVLICLPHNVRVRRVRRVCKSLPSDVVDRVLLVVEQAAVDGPSVTFLRLAEEAACDNDVLLQSHVGGMYAESGEEWPQGTPEGNAKFMLQVRLDHPGLGDPWQGRLIVVFLVFDYEQAVRNYPAPSLDKYVPLDTKPKTVRNSGRQLLSH